jgi:glucosamine-phosphate N-acetyltransferase
MSKIYLDELMNLIDQFPGHIEKIRDAYLALLSELTITSYLDIDVFVNNIKRISSMGTVFIAYLGKPDQEDFDIVASGTIIIEPKIIHEGKSVGHIEDIVVSYFMRGQGLSQIILNKLKQFALDNDCYKVILDCADDVKPVYIKNGFQVKGNQMAQYFIVKKSFL